MKLQQLAQTIGATIRGGSPDAGQAEITSAARLEDAQSHQVSFLANPRYLGQVATSAAGAIIVGKEVVADGKVLLVCQDPYFAFRNAVVTLHGFRRHPAPADGPVSKLAVIDPTATIGAGTVIHPFAVVSDGAVIGKDCVIYPHTFIGPRAKIGDNCQLFPNVTIYDDCVLGNRVTLHAGCIIGQDGFGYATHKGAHHKIPQAGNVVIEDDVEMGANCAVDRATLGSTIIGKGTKFSDLIAIGHGSKIGKHNLLVALVGIAGSAETGDYVALGGQVGVAGHLKIGNMVQVAAQSGVMTDIPDGIQVGGSPAQNLSDAKRIVLSLQRLPELVARIKKLERELEKLKVAE